MPIESPTRDQYGVDKVLASGLPGTVEDCTVSSARGIPPVVAGSQFLAPVIQPPTPHRSLFHSNGVSPAYAAVSGNAHVTSDSRAQSVESVSTFRGDADAARSSMYTPTVASGTAYSSETVLHNNDGELSTLPPWTPGTVGTAKTLEASNSVITRGDSVLSAGYPPTIAAAGSPRDNRALKGDTSASGLFVEQHYDHALFATPSVASASFNSAQQTSGRNTDHESTPCPPAPRTVVPPRPTAQVPNVQPVVRVIAKPQPLSSFAKSMASQCPSTANKTAKRHFKFTKDAIRGISHPDIRRLARRGGVKRISATVYNDIRAALKQRLELILRRIVAVVEHAERRTVSVQDVVFVMAGLGNPIYGFDMDGAEFGKGKEEE